MSPRKKSEKSQADSAPAAVPSGRRSRRSVAADSATARPPARRRARVAATEKPERSSDTTLVIVESPAKAKTIERYLGDAYEVVSTMGHIRDLPKDRFGIDLKKDFKPYWRIIPARVKLLKELQERAARVTNVLIATDPDREGEAIGYHVAEEIKASKPHIARVEFHEITEHAVRESLQHPREIDFHKVNSQFARRILDRIVGYRLSPILWKSVRSGLSAGRVQSVAVRVICDREHKIKHFVPETYYRILLTLSAKDRPDEKFVAEIFKIEGKRRRVKTKDEAETIVAKSKAGPLIVQDFLETEREHHPAAPLVTSTFQQAAVNRLGMTARHAMVVAQQLYEGVNCGKYGRRGLITYHRTDSVRISPVALTAARAIIRDRFGDRYVPVKPNVYKNRRAAQDAHEAIRPSEVELTPDMLTSYLNDEQRQIYTLVWETFVAGQMKSAVYDVRTVYAGVAGSAEFQFVSRGESLKFDGHLKLTGIPKKEGFVPALKKNDPLTLHEHKTEEKQTQPLPRFTEATLVRELEHRGIGRPSTYATIISTIVDRGYVLKQNKELVPTELGEITNKLLIEHFPMVLDIDFTAGLEDNLDGVEEGRMDWRKVLQSFYNDFGKLLEHAQENLKDKKKEITKPPIDVACLSCGRPMVMRWSRYGKFLACSGYPECHSVRDIDESGGQFRVLDIEVYPEPCPSCGAQVQSRRGPFGKFWACIMFPKCKYTRPVTLGVPCPKKCGGEVVRRRTKIGRFFYGCSSYPSCDFTSWLEPISEKCPLCDHPFLVKSKQRGKNIVKCPNKECTHLIEEAPAAPARAEGAPVAGGESETTPEGPSESSA